MSVKCPICGERIDHLKLYVSGAMEYYMDEEENYEEVEFHTDEDIEEFQCPECSTVLFDHQPIEAAEFLKGK